MNQENDPRDATDIDPAVSDLMRALGDETAPEHLDRAIMREAGRAMRADNRSGSFGAWFRPFAFMVMVGLSLAIILDLAELGIFEPLPGPASDSPPAAAAPDPVDRAPDARARIDNQATLNERKRQEKSPAATARAGDEQQKHTVVAGRDASAAVVADTTRGDQGKLSALRSAAPAVERAEVRDASSAEYRRADIRPQSPEGGGAAVSLSQPPAALVAPQAAADDFSQLKPTACSEEQRSDPDVWWQCIDSLRQAGQAEAADREQEDLRNAFPEFVPAQ